MLFPKTPGMDSARFPSYLGTACSTAGSVSREREMVDRDVVGHCGCHCI
jgi:hypothetical protein